MSSTITDRLLQALPTADASTVQQTANATSHAGKPAAATQAKGDGYEQHGAAAGKSDATPQTPDVAQSPPTAYRQALAAADDALRSFANAGGLGGSGGDLALAEMNKLNAVANKLSTSADVDPHEPEHLQAMSYRAYELLRLGEARRALKLYLALYALDPCDFTHQRGAAYCFSRIRQYGFAVGYFRLAMASAGRKDLACLIGAADALAALGDREGARAYVAEALALNLGEAPKHEQPLLEHAQRLHARLAA